MLTAPAEPRLYEKTFYKNTGNLPLLSRLKATDQLILDVGCGAGDNARILRERGLRVHGVTISAAEAKAAAPFMERVQVADVSRWTPDYAPATFDAILLAHVIEHIADPLTTLELLKGLLKPGGTLYLAAPNIAYWRERLSLLTGKFEYENTGTRDRTHLRFYTYHSVKELVESAGYRIVTLEALGHIPCGPVRRFFPEAIAKLDRAACALFPNLLGFQTVLSATRPG